MTASATDSATDFAWVPGSLLGSHLGYCVGLVKGISPEELLGRLQADRQGTCTGLTALYRRNDDVQRRLDYEYGHFQLIGAAPVRGAGGQWTVMVEFNVAVGFNHRLMTQVSAGTQAVTHHLNPVGKGGFHCWQDGRLLTRFEWPGDRGGEDPDMLNEAIDRVGVGAAEGRKSEEYFALAEHVTGARLTPELLEQATFSAGIVAVTKRARERGWS